jgi:hypothetical protein
MDRVERFFVAMTITGFISLLVALVCGLLLGF